MAALPTQTLEFLRRVKTGKARPGDGRDIWRAMRVPGLVTIIGKNSVPLERPIRHQDVAGFRLTRRGEEALSAPSSTRPAFQSLPQPTQHWLSSLKRCFRNVPKGVIVSYDDHKLEVRNESGVIDMIDIPLGS